MTRNSTENSRAPPMRHHGFKMVRRVSDTYEMCNYFTLSCYTNVLIYRNIHFSNIYLRMLKLQQKFTLFWIFPRIYDFVPFILTVMLPLDACGNHDLSLTCSEMRISLRLE